MGCQNCFKVYSTKFRWRLSRKELKSDIFGGIWVTNFPTTGKIFSKGLSKRKSLCPEDFSGKDFSGELFFGLRAVNLAIFGETIIDSLSKPLSTVFEELWKKISDLKKLYAFNT